MKTLDRQAPVRPDTLDDDERLEELLERLYAGVPARPQPAQHARSTWRDTPGWRADLPKPY